MQIRNADWETIKALLTQEIDELDHLVHFANTTAVNDDGAVILVDVRDAPEASLIARRYAAAVNKALTLARRPETVVRMRANLAQRYEEPDYYYRDIPLSSQVKTA